MRFSNGDDARVLEPIIGIMHCLVRLGWPLGQEFLKKFKKRLKTIRSCKKVQIFKKIK
jgi:hypothetical protein